MTEVGDVVQLKSGGPAMTVTAVEDGSAVCSWWSDGKMTTAPFDLRSLGPAEPDRAPPPPARDLASIQKRLAGETSNAHVHGSWAGRVGAKR